MRSFVARILPGVVFLAASAHAGKEPYDDRKIVDRALKVTVSLTGLVPSPRSCASRAGNFKKGSLHDRLHELRDIHDAVASALRWAGQSQEITRHRRAIANRIRTLLARADAYGRSADSLAAAAKNLLAVKRAKPNC